MIDEERFPVKEISSEKEKLLYKYAEKCGCFVSKRHGADWDNLAYSTCHAKIMNEIHGVTDLCSVYAMGEEGAEEIWEYITSLEGPFRDIFKSCPDGWSFLRPDEKNSIFAFKAPDSIFKFTPYPLVYSFLICSRIPHEYPDWAVTFKELIKRGVDKNKAFLSLPYIKYDGSSGSFKTGRGNWDGIHKCLRDNEHYLIDVEMWCSGKYHTKDIMESSSSSLLWRLDKTVNSPRNKSFINFGWTAYGKESKSRFGAKIFAIDDDGLKKLFNDLDRFIELRYK